MPTSPTPKRRGRPTGLTPEVQDRIVQALEAGNYKETAAAYAGIGVSTLYRWLEWGADPDGQPIYQEFREAVQSAISRAEVRNVALIQKAAQDGTWQAAAWFLERSAPARWGRWQRVEITGEDGGPVQIEHRSTLAEKLEAMRQRSRVIIEAATVDDLTTSDGDEPGELRAIG